MSEVTTRSVEHATFVIERTYPATRERVFSAFSDKHLKARWFSDGSPATQWDFDFREGGKEYNSGEYLGQTHTFDATYLEIVENERIAWAYNMYVGGVKLSSSLTIVELSAADGGTKITFTETGAFYDGHENPKLREEGSGQILDALGASLQGTQ